MFKFTISPMKILYYILNVLILVTLPKGTYHFFEDRAFVREYYISNHDQTSPKKVGIALENLRNVTIDGNGSEFVFHGRMIPISLLNSENITLKNFSIDFELPALRQLNVLDVNADNDELISEIYPSGNYRIEDGRLIIVGESFEIVPETAMSFREDKRLTYLRRDLYFNPEVVSEKSPNVLSIKGWYQINETTPRERFILRSYYRPTPGIFINECLDTYLENVTVHYAEGMGLLAQMSENITWTPEVIFSNNTIRNNRGRGSLFSTPKRVFCEGNLFDHTHGAAILLCGDSNGWYETGACRDVIIRNNRFVNSLTANYQFTNAVISIYPEIPNLIDQKKFFHSGIVIENNQFENGFDTDNDLRVELSDNSNILIK